MPLDTSRSVEELEGVCWLPPTFLSYVIRTSHALRRKPLRDLTNEEIRLGLGQHVGVAYLIPLAIERLRSDPLMQVTFYGGDLLKNLLEVPFSYWQRHPDLHAETARLFAAALEQAPLLDEEDRDFDLPVLLEAYDRFTGRLPSHSWIRPDEGQEPPPIIQLTD